MSLIDKILLVLLPLPFTTLGLTFLTFGNNYIPEIFLFLWLFFAFILSSSIRNFSLLIISSKLFLISFSILIFISLFSFFREDFDPITFYGRFRALLACLIGYVIVRFCSKRNWGENLSNNLILFLSSACIMYFISSIISSNSDNTKISISMICFSTVIYLFSEKNKLFPALIFSILACLVAYLSFFRQNYFIALLLIIFIFLNIIFKSIKFKEYSVYIGKSNFLSLLLLSFFLFVVTSISGYLYDYLASDESKYIQSIGKINDLSLALQNGGLDESGELRVKSYLYLLDNLEFFLLPNGLINDNLLYLKSIWGGGAVYLGMSITRDSILAYLIVNFGFILAMLISIFIFIRLISLIVLDCKTIFYKIMFIGPSILLVFFLDGATLTQLQKSLFFGLALGLCLSILKKKDVKKTDFLLK